MACEIQHFAIKRQLESIEVKGLVRTKVCAAVSRHPQVVAFIRKTNGAVFKLIETGQWKIASVSILQAEIQTTRPAIRSVRIERMPLIEITVEMDSARGIFESRMGVRVGNPSEQFVGAPPLKEELDSAAISSQYVMQ